MSIKELWKTSIGNAQFAALLDFFMMFALLIIFSLNVIILFNAFVYNQLMEVVIQWHLGTILGLLVTAMLVGYVMLQLKIILRNRKARFKSACFMFSQTKAGLTEYVLIISGLFLLDFVVYFFFIFRQQVGYRTTYGLPVDYSEIFTIIFSSPAHALIYLFAVAVLGVHMSYIFPLLNLTLGWQSRITVAKFRYRCISLSVLVVLALESVPVYCLLRPILM